MDLYEKLYKEAIHRASGFRTQGYKDVAEYIFPELAESEDERIRKALIFHFQDDGSLCNKEGNISNTDIVAWLEKQGEIIKEWSEMKRNNIQTELQDMVDLKQKTEQGEQKEATCVAEIIDRLSEKEQEILFKELDMQKEHNKFIESIQIGDQVTRNQDGMLVNLSQLKRVAKPSEKQGEQKPADKVEPKFHVGDKVKRKDNPHLTYILKRLTDDGDYEFHAIGKDGHEGCTCFAGVKYQDEWELVEQNPAWSEEDMEMIGNIRRIIEQYAFSNSAVDVNGDLCEKEYIEADNWLKSLKDRVQLQPKQEWSEEDKDAIDQAILALEDLYDDYCPLCHYDGYKLPYDKAAKRLKSLRPQSQWKPSDEQMKALYEATLEGEPVEALETLLSDLKKLKK